jgi:predicted DNA-binding protein
MPVEGSRLAVTIQFTTEVQRRLEVEAAREGREPAEYARQAVEEKLDAAAARMERNQRAIALLDQWLSEPPDPEEEEGYPTEITPLSLREVSTSSAASVRLME